MSSGRRILVGVSGGIAAVKVPMLVRRLSDAGFEVRCALTRAAESFVTRLSLEVLTGAAVWGDDYLSPGHQGREEHIAAAAWADAIMVAPATADLLAKAALGLGSDFLSTTLLAFDGPVLMAPAMHGVMWSRPVTVARVEELRRRGVRFIGPVEGPLASGEEGMGRMSEPDEIVQAASALFSRSLAGRTVLVTAGPTREALDPVRFLSNRSSGRMGYALAAEAAWRGARTILVSGPVDLPAPAAVERVAVDSAHQMYEAVAARAADADVVIMAAAVADFRPAEPAATKIKKGGAGRSLSLEPTRDILASLADLAPRALRVGFAAETGDPVAEGRRKLAEKRADLIVANDVGRSDIGFGSDYNEVVVITHDDEPQLLARASKRELAATLMDRIERELQEAEGADAARAR